MKEFDVNGFKAAIASSAPTVVDFWADWCMPCKMVAPVLEELSDKLDGKVDFGKVNIDDYSGLASEYGVQSIPTMIVFKDGKEVDRLVGVRPAAELQTVFERHI